MPENHPRLVFVTGGVLSSLGKGIIAGSLGTLLEQQGLKVTIVKVDPYLNIDSGTMSPFQHGEVFVTEDGSETDLDLGTYERFLNHSMQFCNHITAGKIFYNVIERERRGDYLGSTVQVIPHITEEIKKQILNQNSPLDVIIVEIGGTVGDIESQPFLEAVRQLCFELDHAVSIHVTLVPYIGTSGELKTKPTQHSVKELRSMGLTADLIVCRTSSPLGESERAKIALFANLQPDEIFESPDVGSVYQIPMILYEQGLVESVLKKIGYPERPIAAPFQWEAIVHRIQNPKHAVKIAIVGKYSSLTDAYKSINEALLHGGISADSSVEIIYIPAEDLEKDPENYSTVLRGYDGVLVPGGFGDRGIEGKIFAAKICRENHIPYFGICLGMQIAVIEYCRSVLGKPLAHSAEFSSTSPDLIFNWITQWKNQKNKVEQRSSSSDKGGTMRLGSYTCNLTIGTQVQRIYGTETISERHRHRFELNPEYIEALIEKGFIVSGRGPMDLVEVMELSDHPWFIGTQYHPEFQSKPCAPHPLFQSFIQASLAHQDRRARKIEH